VKEKKGRKGGERMRRKSEKRIESAAALFLRGGLRLGRARRRASLGLAALALALLLQVLGEQLGVLRALHLVLLRSLLAERQSSSLTLEAYGRDEALDLGRLVLLLLAFFEGERSSHDILPHVVVLGEVEELADLGGSLGAARARHEAVGEAVDLGLALLDDDEREHGEVHVDDAALDRLAAALARATLAVARVAAREQQTHAVVGEDALLHGEALLVVAAADAHDVALPLIAQATSVDLLRDALVHERSQLLVIVDVDELLGTGGRIRYIQLHCDLINGLNYSTAIYAYRIESWILIYIYAYKKLVFDKNSINQFKSVLNSFSDTQLNWRLELLSMCLALLLLL